jgi:hypothetical protein
VQSVGHTALSDTSISLVAQNTLARCQSHVPVSDSKLADAEKERDDARARLEGSASQARASEDMAASVISTLSARVAEHERERTRLANEIPTLRARAASSTTAEASLAEQVAALSRELGTATTAAAASKAEAHEATARANKLAADLTAERAARADAETLVTAFKAKASQGGADRRTVADAERVAIETIERFHVVEASLAAERDASSRLRRELHAESERRSKLEDENHNLRARSDRCVC